MKFLVAAISLAGLLGATSVAVAQAPNYLVRNRAVYGAYAGSYRNGVIVNGRCGGISYGTGARSCGTATGGPVGGISGRN